MELPIYQIDAFTDNVFGGNPAAVCPLEQWLPAEVMQRIAMENSVAETAFFVREGEGFAIRWFTPEIEMDLCGHATLAAAHVIKQYIHAELNVIGFHSASGELQVSIDGDLLTLNLPSRPPVISDIPQVILDAFEQTPVEILKSRDYILIFNDEDIIRHIEPDQTLLNTINLDPGGIVVTAKGRDVKGKDKKGHDVDFVSRFFTPQASVFEDPVTGSAHCSLIPYWSRKLGKKQLIAKQLSARGGDLYCEDLGERVTVSGKAITYMRGTIFI